MKSVMSLEKCSQIIQPDWQFGIDAPAVAKQLRDIADEIDAGSVLIQKATVYHRLTVDEFATAAIVLQVTERVNGR
jgi:hypothetical protein